MSCRAPVAYLFMRQARTGHVRRFPTALLPLVAGLGLLAGCAPSGVPGGSPTATATASATAKPTPIACSNATVLATWSLTQLAEQTIVIPVAETDVASIMPEVAAGAGGVILFGATAPANLG